MKHFSGSTLDGAGLELAVAVDERGGREIDADEITLGVDIDHLHHVAALGDRTVIPDVIELKCVALGRFVEACFRLFQLGPLGVTLLVDIATCPNCGGGGRKIIAAILKRPVIEQPISHDGESGAASLLMAKAA
jgi:hypothetical protein